MSLDFYTPPDIEEIIARVKTYIKSELKQLNPTDQNNVIFSLVVAMANLSNDNNKQILTDILPNCFPQHCNTVEALENFATIKNVPRTQATASSGLATIQGNRGVVIPLGTIFIANNNQFRTSGTVEISNTVMQLKSLSVNGTIVTATTASTHNFASNNTVTISGAESELLNGDFVITSTGLDSFTYTIPQSETTEETGNELLASTDMAILNLSCLSSGSSTNLSNGDALAIGEQIEGLNANAYTQFSGISGGSDLQKFDDWKDDVVDRFKNPITFFNKNNIEKTAKGIAGVTRVWVEPCTPDVGQVTVYFIRGNDADIIPNYNEVSKVATAIRALRTVKDDGDDVIVKAPIKKVVDFNFSSISPNTATMKTAIQNSLKQLFEDEINLSTNITELTYNNAIGNSYDSETGSKLSTYTLSNPTSDIEVKEGEYPVLGNITFE